MAKIKWVTIAAILILVLSFTMPFVPAHTALANGGITPVYVNVATGNDAWSGSSPTYISGSIGPKKTIGGANGGFNAVSSPGTVNVAAGTYPEYNFYFDKSFTLAGAGAPSTIIDGGGTGGVIQVAGSSITISGLTIQNGYAPTAMGGLGLIGGATVTVNDCVIRNNIGRNGGGVGVQASTLYMNRCTINGNSTPDWPGGGGGGIQNVGSGTASTAYLTNCTISGNTASGNTYGYGGGIGNFGEDATMTLTNCTLVNNSATGSPGRGGGFYNDHYSTITFKNTIVANNTATGGAATTAITLVPAS